MIGIISLVVSIVGLILDIFISGINIVMRNELKTYKQKEDYNENHEKYVTELKAKIRYYYKKGVDDKWYHETKVLLHDLLQYNQIFSYSDKKSLRKFLQILEKSGDDKRIQKLNNILPKIESIIKRIRE